MKRTAILEVDPEKPDIEKVRVAAQIIRKGGLVAFPTETVYGLGANALHEKAIQHLFEAKKRPLDNPPIVHIGERKDLDRLVDHIPDRTDDLMRRFWPGPLTLVFKRSRIVPDMTVAGLDTIAIRMPRHAVALTLIKESRCPIAAPSANIAGRPSPTSAKHVFDDLAGRIDVILDGGSTEIGVESTVLDMSHASPQILRPGGVSFEEIRSILSDVILHPAVSTDKELELDKVHSPGMKHKHYAPKATVIVVEGALPNLIAKIQELIEQDEFRSSRVGVLATDETVASYKADVVKSVGSRYNMAAIASNLFGTLREFDKAGVDVIIAEGLPTDGIGLAIMNRLRKSSAYNIIKA